MAFLVSLPFGLPDPNRKKRGMSGTPYGQARGGAFPHCLPVTTHDHGAGIACNQQRNKDQDRDPPAGGGVVRHASRWASRKEHMLSATPPNRACFSKKLAFQGDFTSKYPAGTAVLYCSCIAEVSFGVKSSRITTFSSESHLARSFSDPAPHVASL